MSQKIAFILQQTPFSSDFSSDAIDAVLAGGLYGQAVSVFFVGDGVFQLVDSENNTSPIKPLSKKLKALSLYDVESLYVCQDALAKRGLRPTDCCIDVDCVASNRLDQLIRQHDVILSF